MVVRLLLSSPCVSMCVDVCLCVQLFVQISHLFACGFVCNFIGISKATIAVAIDTNSLPSMVPRHHILEAPADAGLPEAPTLVVHAGF